MIRESIFITYQISVQTEGYFSTLPAIPLVYLHTNPRLTCWVFSHHLFPIPSISASIQEAATLWNKDWKNLVRRLALNDTLYHSTFPVHTTCWALFQESMIFLDDTDRVFLKHFRDRNNKRTAPWDGRQGGINCTTSFSQSIWRLIYYLLQKLQFLLRKEKQVRQGPGFAAISWSLASRTTVLC